MKKWVLLEHGSLEVLHVSPLVFAHGEKAKCEEPIVQIDCGAFREKRYPDASSAVHAVYVSAVRGTMVEIQSSHLRCHRGLALLQRR